MDHGFPQVTYILHALKDRGFDVDVNATTTGEAVDTDRLKVTVIRSRKTIAFIPFTMNRNGTWERPMTVHE